MTGVTRGLGGTGYTLAMQVRRISVKALVLGVMVVVTGSAAWAADDIPTLTSPAGETVDWQEFVAERGPLAVVLWASWAPRADSVRESFGELADAARTQELTLVVIDVQESFDEAKKILGEGDFPWLHDRHGSVMKTLRVIRVPGVVVVTAAGDVAERLEPTPEALRQWSPR